MEVEVGLVGRAVLRFGAAVEQLGAEEVDAAVVGRDASAPADGDGGAVGGRAGRVPVLVDRVGQWVAAVGVARARRPRRRERNDEAAGPT